MSVWRASFYLLAGVALLGAAAIAYFAYATRAEINGFEARLREVAHRSAGPAKSAAQSFEDLPAPVRRYFEFVFPAGAPAQMDLAQQKWVEVEMEGEFRRPLTDSFAPTRARQVVDVKRPNMVFSADTPIVGPAWAIAYDVYIDGEMEMRARLLSAFTVMAQDSTPELDTISLRRWLLESPLYPMALLPGGPVRWEPIDAYRARAVAQAFGRTTSLVATFDESGALVRFDAEQDGDLTTPYHGSGEHVARGDYRLIDGVMVPTSFKIARAAQGELYPFWIGRVVALSFHK